MALGSGCAGWWRWQWRWPLPTAQKSGWAGRDRADPEFPPILFLSHPLSSEPHWKGEWEREPLALPAQRGLCSGIAGSESGTQSPVLPCPHLAACVRRFPALGFSRLHGGEGGVLQGEQGPLGSPSLPQANPLSGFTGRGEVSPVRGTHTRRGVTSVHLETLLPGPKVFLVTTKVLVTELPLGWDFPGGPLAKTSCSQCRGPGFRPWSGN